MNRRVFMGTMVPGIAALGANDRINVAVAGLGGRGREMIGVFAAQPGCRVAAVCDIDQARMEQAAQLCQPKPKTFGDLRRLLDDKEIDAVVVTACNHWHALATIWCCQASKDVYVEKPVSHNVWEGRRMVEAARKYNRIVQSGMQCRSIQHRRRAIERLHEGVIGKLYMAKGLCFKRRLSIGRKPDGPVPAGVDYDLWLGPAAFRPFNPNRFHYNWHWFWATGNGDIGNQGPHQMDLARWGLGNTTLPKRVVSTGAKFIHDDDQQTPNTQTAIFEYEDRHIVFEIRGLLTGGESSIAFDGGNYIGNLFFGSEGFMSLDAGGYQIYLGEKRELAESMKRVELSPDDPAPHVANFLDAVRSRRPDRLAAPIEEGHLSAALCHLANISYRTGRKLEFDTAAEHFSADTEANALLSRKYRPPFVVPARV